MEGWIEFAKGPLFAMSFIIMILGLARHVIIQIYSLAVRKGKRLRNVPWRKIILDTLSWTIPIKHMIPGTRFFSCVSFLSHIGIILVPLLLVDHIVMWEDFLGINLPQMGHEFADAATLFTMVALLLLLYCRIFIRRQRAVSSASDYILLVLVFLPFASGYLASHPSVNPVSWEAAMLIHLLSAELLFVVIPFTKLAHIVLFLFDRISEVHWQLRPGAGDKVAESLYGKEVTI
jgi:nitrate reductase gamma subunit